MRSSVLLAAPASLVLGFFSVSIRDQEFSEEQPNFQGEEKFTLSEPSAENSPIGVVTLLSSWLF